MRLKSEFANTVTVDSWGLTGGKLHDASRHHSYSAYISSQ